MAAIRFMKLEEENAIAKKRRKLVGGGGGGGSGWSSGAKQPIDVSFKHWPGQVSRTSRPKRTQAAGDAMSRLNSSSVVKKNRGRGGRSLAAGKGILEQGVPGPGGVGTVLASDAQLISVDDFDEGSRLWYPDVHCPTSAVAGLFGCVCGTGE